jgi:hypothetical protein
VAGADVPYLGCIYRHFPRLLNTILSTIVHRANDELKEMECSVCLYVVKNAVQCKQPPPLCLTVRVEGRNAT